MSDSIIKPPGDPILDRDGVPDQIEEDLSEYLSYLITLTDWGVDFMKRALLKKDEAKIPDVVLVHTLYRQVLVCLDSIHLQLSEGAIRASVPSLRSLFEVFLSIEWILDKGKERWGAQFYVGELRQRRSWAAKFVPGTPEHQELQQAAAGAFKQELNDPKKQQKAKQQIKKIDNHVQNHPQLKRINQAFIDERGGRSHEPRWYQPDNGPRSIKQMAEKLGHLDWYLVLYSSWSEVAHGSRTRGHVTIQPSQSQLLIQPIRSVEGLDQIFSLARVFGEMATKMLVEEYRPGELDRLSKKVLTEWDDRRNMPEIEVKTNVIAPYS